MQWQEGAREVVVGGRHGSRTKGINNRSLCIPLLIVKDKHAAFKRCMKHYKINLLIPFSQSAQ